MGGESEAAWRALLDDLVARGLKTPEFLIIDGAAGLEKALAALWPEPADTALHGSQAQEPPGPRTRSPARRGLGRLYRHDLRRDAEGGRRAPHSVPAQVAAASAGRSPTSLEEAGDRLFTFTRLPPGQWRSARTTNAVERLHEEFKRRIKTQTVLPSPETAAMLFWALLASGQITMRKVNGWQTLATKPADAVIDLAHEPLTLSRRRRHHGIFHHIPDSTAVNDRPHFGRGRRRHRRCRGGHFVASPRERDEEWASEDETIKCIVSGGEFLQG